MGQRDVSSYTGLVMLRTKMFGYVDPCHGRPLVKCRLCELTWCVLMCEHRGVSALGVEFDLREQWVMGCGREYTAQKNDQG